MAPTFSRKSALFLILGVFALLFLAAQSVAAAECRSYDSSNLAYPDNPDPYWQKAGNPAIDNCTIQYDDPVGGSNLTVCQYRVLSNGVPTTISSPGLSDGWRNDAVGTCAGSSATLSMDISIGANLNCRDNGLDKCEVQFKAEDNSGNSATGTVVTLDIDYTLPTVTINQASGQADSTNASPINFTAVFSESVSGFTGTDVTIRGTAGGTKTVTVTGSGTTYNVAVAEMTSGTVIATIPAGGATDAAGNGNTVSTSTYNTVTYDIIAPTVTAFSINGTSCSGNNCNNQIAVNSTFTIAWTVSESGGSYLKNAKIYRAVFNNTNCSNTDKSGCFWEQVGSTVSAPASLNSWSGAITDNPPDNTYWYGIHALDNAGNCITEAGAHCGGVSSDGLDTRIVRGPIKVKMQHNQAPVAVNDSYTVNEDTLLTKNATEGVLANDTDANNNPLTALKVTDPSHGTVTLNTNGSFTYTPTVNYNGSDSFTYKANDGTTDSNTATVTIAVTAVNDAPTISNIADQTTNEDTATSAIAFTVGDVETAPASLTLTKASSNTTLVPAANIVFGGSGASRTVTVTPAANQNGSATVTVTVSDGSLTASDTFVLTVNAVNDAPTISNIADQTTNEDTATSAIAFTVGDVDNPVADLTPNKASSNTALVPLANIVFGGFGANRTVTVTPAENQNGSATITVTVSDGSLTASDTFVLTVIAVNDAPIISTIADQTTNEDAATSAIAFTVEDPETVASFLTLTKASSNTTLVPTTNIVFGGSGVNRTVKVTPAANQNGSATITVTVSDGSLTASDTFVLTVTDGKAPTVDSFKVNNKTFPTPPIVNVNSSFLVEWGVSESGGSNLKEIQTWRAWDANGDGNLQPSEWNDSSPASGTQANPIFKKTTGFDSSSQDTDSTSENPLDGTYWYGLHIVDNAGNCIQEDTTDDPATPEVERGHCGGVLFDTLDTRTDRGPIKVNMQHNSRPTIQGSPSDSPDPIKANAQITFSVSWSDVDIGNTARIHICKTQLISGQTCSGGSWCDFPLPPDFTAASPTSCSYTTQAADAGSQVYFATVCDNDNMCSLPKFGSFLVDATAPTITTFTATPVPPSWINNGSPNATVTWSVSDSGGANLKKIEVWRAWDANGNGVLDITPISEWSNPGNGQSNPLCTKTGGPPKCTNDQNFDTASTDSDSYIDTNLSASSVYWYGLHVADKADNMGKESTSLKVQVDKDEPNSQIQSPASNSWFSNDFNLDTLDEDLLSKLDTTQCQYKIIPFEDTNGDGIVDIERASSGWLSRTCNAPPSAPVTPITVGPTDYCKYQAKSSCWVYVRSQDVAGNLHTPTQPAGSIKLYNIDWTQPQPGKLYLTAKEGDQTYPIQVQLDRSDTYKVHVTDNLKVSGCSLYIDGIDQGVMTPTVPGCEKDCTFTKGFTFTGTGTYHNNYAACKDAANNSKSGTPVNVEVKTLSVVLSAVPPVGSVNTLFDLVGTVSGTMTGNINYKFDCDTSKNPSWNFEIDNINLSTSDPGWVTRQGKQTKVTAPDTFAVQDLCQYSPPSPPVTYTAKVSVQRGVGIAEDTVSIPVTANSLPAATNLQNNNATADYCFVSSPPVTLSWTFSDPGDSQSAYRVQIATNPGFGSPIDTCPSPQGEAGGTCTPGHNAQAYAPPNLSYGTTYYWRVKVKDSAGDFSSWAIGISFTTPVHPYPVPNFTKTPDSPGAQESVQFTDQTNFTAGATNKTWSWNFGDSGSSTLQNPTHTYTQTGTFGVTLQTGDDVGSCSNQKTVNVSIPFPEWQEISPF